MSQPKPSPSAPVAAAPLAMNRPASASKSLYQICLNMRSRLLRVPGLEPYVRTAKTIPATPILAIGAVPESIGVDVVTQISRFSQMGAGLCTLFNVLIENEKINQIKIKKLPVIISDDIRICKRSVYNFVQACKTELGYKDSQLFTISNIFSTGMIDTFGLIRVIATINLLLDKMEFKNLLIENNNTKDLEMDEKEIETKTPKSKVIRELLETERKYVQDLKVMLDYKIELQSKEFIDSFSINTLFPNLNDIVDFQQKFLIGVELQASLPPHLQRFGSLFIQGAPFFTMYDSFAMNQRDAIEIITNQSAKLKASSTLIDSKYELQSFLIKPVQRLCKYPLLLKELIKYSNIKEESSINENFNDNHNDNDQYYYYEELLQSLELVKKVTKNVNETQRKLENISTMKELEEKVTDWKGYKLESFGDLLHHGVISVSSEQDSLENNFDAYLFQTIILFFQKKDSSIKNSNSNSNLNSNINNSTTSLPISISSTTTNNSTSLTMSSTLNNINNTNKKSSSNNKKNKKLNSSSYELMGRIFIARITDILTSSEKLYTLTILWSGYHDVGEFNLRFRTEEMYQQWSESLKRLVIALKDDFSPSTTTTSTSTTPQQSSIHFDNNFNRNHLSLPVDKVRPNRNLSSIGRAMSTISNLDLRKGSNTNIGIGNNDINQDLRNRSVSTPNILDTPLTPSTPNHNFGYPALPPLPNDLPPVPIHKKSVNDLNSIHSRSRVNSYDHNGNITEQYPSSISSASFKSTTISTPSSSFSTSNLDHSTAHNTKPSNASNLQSPSQSSSSTIIDDKIRIKLLYQKDSFTLIVSPDTTFQQLKTKLETKIKRRSNNLPNDPLIRYKDEDGDLINLQSEEDVEMAFDLIRDWRYDDIVDENVEEENGIPIDNGCERAPTGEPILTILYS